MQCSKQAEKIAHQYPEFPFAGLFFDMTDELLEAAGRVIRDEVETSGDKKLMEVYTQASKQFVAALRDWRENAYRNEKAQSGMERFEAEIRFNSLIFYDLDAVLENLHDLKLSKDKKKKNGKNAIEKIKGYVPDKLPWPFDDFDISKIKKLIDQILNIFLTTGADAGASLDTPLSRPST